MKTFFSDLIPRIKRFSEKLDNLTLLTNQHWVVIDDINNNKSVYIFRNNNELLISQNGKVEKARWEYLGNNALLIDRKNESYLFKHGFFDANVLALKIDSKDEYALLVNETKFEKELNNSLNVLEFLNNFYLTGDVAKKIQYQAGISLHDPMFEIGALVINKANRKQMRVLAFDSRTNKYSCYTYGGTYYEGDFSSFEIELF